MTPSTITVPDELKKRFPELIALILGSESMNDEERQYWINILPAMTEEQQKNLKDILQNEKDQLAAIDAKYAKEAEKAPSLRALHEIDAERKEKKSSRTKKEEETQKEEAEKEEEILKAIAGLDQ